MRFRCFVGQLSRDSVVDLRETCLENERSRTTVAEYAKGEAISARYRAFVGSLDLRARGENIRHRHRNIPPSSSRDWHRWSEFYDQRDLLTCTRCTVMSTERELNSNRRSASAEREPRVQLSTTRTTGNRKKKKKKIERRRETNGPFVRESKRRRIRESRTSKSRTKSRRFDCPRK